MQTVHGVYFKVFILLHVQLFDLISWHSLRDDATRHTLTLPPSPLLFGFDRLSLLIMSVPWMPPTYHFHSALSKSEYWTERKAGVVATTVPWGSQGNDRQTCQHLSTECKCMILKRFKAWMGVSRKCSSARRYWDLPGLFISKFMVLISRKQLKEGRLFSL